MKTFDFYLHFLFNMYFFRSVILNHDSILNEYVFGYSEYVTMLNFYNIAFDFYVLFKVWHKLIFHNLKFNIIISHYANFYNMLVNNLDYGIENYVLVDFYYTNKLNSLCRMHIGFFTNFLFLKKYLFDYKKTVFLLLCEQYMRDSFYRDFVQYTQKLQELYVIPDFLLVFGSEDKLPSNAFELLSLNLVGLGIFDLNVSYTTLVKFPYYFICGDLSNFMCFFLFKLLVYDYICALYERMNALVLRYKNGVYTTELCDLNFNLLYLTKYNNIYNNESYYALLDYVLLLIYTQRLNIVVSNIYWNNTVDFFLYLYIYLYLNIVISNVSYEV